MNAAKIKNNQIPAASSMDWRGKIAVLRSDLNTPMKEGDITDDTRIRESAPTIQHILQNGGGVVCLSHLGRPRAGRFEEELSLRPVAKRLSEILKTPVKFCADIPETGPEPGEVWMLENVRFNEGEKHSAPGLAFRYAELGDVFVMDAFATAHRRECSTCQIAYAADASCTGLLMEKEIAALSRVMDNPTRPFTAIVGGAKISTKLTALEHLSDQCDYLIPGGGIANTILAAIGAPVGGSLAEHSMKLRAREVREKFRGRLGMACDLIVSDEISATAKTRLIQIEDLPDTPLNENERILDAGKDSRKMFAEIIAKSRTIIWSGPVGAFEYPPFAEGTRTIARAIANNTDAYSVAGGGDTLAAAKMFEVSDKISYLSTGGGAFLEFVSGTPLPALQALKEACAG